MLATAPRTRRAPLLAVVAAGLAVGLLPPLWGALAAAALLLFVLGLARPRLPLYLLGLAALLASVRAVRVGAVGVSATELLIFVALAAWLGGVAARNDEPRVTGWVVPVGAFLLIGVSSTGWAVSLPAAAKELLRWAELGVALVLAAALIERARQARTLVAVLLVGGVVEALVGAVQFALRIGPPSFEVGRFFRAHGTFGQPNPFGGYLEMVMPLALALAYTGATARLARAEPSAPAARRLWLPVLAAAALAATAAALAMSFSRGAWLGALVGLAAMMVAAGRRTTAAVLLALLVATLVALLGAFEVLPVGASERLAGVTRFYGVFDVREVRPDAENWGIVERMAHWQAAYEMWLARPWLGMGIGQYAEAYPEFMLPGWNDPLGHAHNYYLNVLAEVGVPGLVGYLAIVLSWFVLAVRRVRGASTALGRGVALGVLGVLAATSTHNLFDNLYVSGMNVHLGLLLGLLAGLPRWERVLD
ncbi:MAG TPA: O-antigen ligase family protein [Chloroflexota bacterium]|nr:O-antigen ligase family protein [Chloroflexota bacterium]